MKKFCSMFLILFFFILFFYEKLSFFVVSNIYCILLYKMNIIRRRIRFDLKKIFIKITLPPWRKVLAPFLTGKSGEKSRWTNSLHSTLLESTRVDSSRFFETPARDPRKMWRENGAERRMLSLPSWLIFLYLRLLSSRSKSPQLKAYVRDNRIFTRDIDTSYLMYSALWRLVFINIIAGEYKFSIFYFFLINQSK